MRLQLAALLALLALPAAPALAQAPARPQPPRPAAPAGDLVTEASLNKTALKAILDQAKLPTEVDAAGNLLVKGEQVTAYVLPGQGTIRFLTSFTFLPKATLAEKLDLANRINEDYIMARATVRGENLGELHTDYYLVIGPGVGRAVVVAAARRFLDVVTEAVPASDTERLIK
jgi:hypothetical protein